MSEIPDQPELARLFTVARAAQYLGIGKTKLYAEINAGHLRAKRSGGQTLIPRAELDRWSDELPDHRPADTHRSAVMREVQRQRRGRRNGQ